MNQMGKGRKGQQIPVCIEEISNRFKTKGSTWKAFKEKAREYEREIEKSQLRKKVTS